MPKSKQLIPKDPDKLRLKKAQRFATKAFEYQIMKHKIFRNYCLNKLGHSKTEWSLISKIFNAHITKENVHLFINTHSSQIYDGIFNGNLEQYSNKSLK